MGIFDRLRRKKKRPPTRPMAPAAAPYPPTAAAAAPAVPTALAVPTPGGPRSVKAEVDLILSQMEALRMQYEAISARLQNIERVVAEIRSFCK